jgi:outer membrane lipoprotein-sorting protein
VRLTIPHSGAFVQQYKTPRRIFFACIFACTIATSPLRASTKDSLESAAIDRIIHFYQELKDFSSEFKQVKSLSKLGIELPSSGLLRVKTQKLFVWDVTEPSFLRIAFDGQKLHLWQGNPDKRSSAQSPQSWDLQKDLPQSVRDNFFFLTALLTMNEKIFAKNFELSSEIPQKEAIVFIPKRSMLFSKITMTAHPDGYIQSILMQEKAGDTIQLNFSKPKPLNSKWSESWQKSG